MMWSFTRRAAARATAQKPCAAVAIQVIRVKLTVAAITALLSVSATQAQDGPYPNEQAARICIQKRLTELVAERHPNIAADAPLTICTNDLKAELKAKGKSYCEAIAYIAWLVADENNKRNGVTGRPYSADKSFLVHCARSETWDKHR
jgi:hypothetical protein